jgi:endogenous inhibitor of DNA gyrase (YacG/DUF329 family)
MPDEVKCPTCRADTPWTGNPYRPFCSERCQLIDLGAWTSERYRIVDKESEIDWDADGDDDDDSRSS